MVASGGARTVRPRISRMARISEAQPGRGGLVARGELGGWGAGGKRPARAAEENLPIPSRGAGPLGALDHPADFENRIRIAGLERDPEFFLHDDGAFGKLASRLLHGF